MVAPESLEPEALNDTDWPTVGEFGEDVNAATGPPLELDIRCTQPLEALLHSCCNQ
jgi:hypothetical protein